jgi:folate-binding protein YgfZ
LSNPIVARVQCISIEGPDARRFAQAQFANDVDALTPGHWQWNAWLDARGRVRALMQLADLGDDRLLAILRGGDATRIRDDLSRYLLRSRATVTAHARAGCSTDAVVAERVVVGPRVVVGYGDRSLGLVPPSAAPDPAAANRWRLADIRAGWPTLPPGVDDLLPPALGLERLGAVAFDKGCYPGQEIAARLHFRGGHKSGLFHVRGPTALAAGTSHRMADGKLVRVLDCANADPGVEALVVCPIDTQSKINVMDIEYHVVSRFEA